MHIYARYTERITILSDDHIIIIDIDLKKGCSEHVAYFTIFSTILGEKMIMNQKICKQLKVKRRMKASLDVVIKNHVQNNLK